MRTELQTLCDGLASPVLSIRSETLGIVSLVLEKSIAPQKTSLASDCLPIALRNKQIVEEDIESVFECIREVVKTQTPESRTVISLIKLLGIYPSLDNLRAILRFLEMHGPTLSDDDAWGVISSIHPGRLELANQKSAVEMLVAEPLSSQVVKLTERSDPRLSEALLRLRNSIRKILDRAN